MEAAAISESHFLRNTELMRELEEYVQDLSFDLPCEIFCSRMNIGAVLRLLGIEIADNYDNDLERLLDYMELSRELDREKLFYPCKPSKLLYRCRSIKIFLICYRPRV